MPKVIALVTVIILIVLLFLKKKPEKTISIQIKDRIFALEIADNPLSRSRGLSKRESLCPTCGMIFIHRQESTYPFWMKNTHFPLDIIWLDKNGKVVDIKQGQPQNLSILKNKTPAQYTVELNQNIINLSVGDIINLPDEIN